MIGVGFQRVADDVGVADFEDPDFDIVVTAGEVDGVHNVLEFAFLVEDGSFRFAFVRGGDGDEDFQGSGEDKGRRVVKCDSGGAAEHGHGGSGREELAVWQADGFKREREEIGAGGFDGDFDVCANRAAVHKRRKGGGGVTGEAEIRERVAKRFELAFGGFVFCLGGAAEGGMAEAVTEGFKGGGNRIRDCVVGCGGL